MLHEIIVDTELNIIKLSNLGASSLFVRFIDNPKNWGIYKQELGENQFCCCILNDEKDINIYINEDGDLYCYHIIINGDEYTLEKINEEEYFNFNNPITLVTGHSGGGTSIVVKLLKVLGVHFGEDSGLISIRKPHESIGFKIWIETIEEENSNVLLRKKFKQISKTYSYKKDLVNAFKMPNIPEKIIKISEVFPNLKIMSVIKKPSLIQTTKEGIAFQNKTEDEIKKMQYFNIEGNPIFHIDFYKFFTDYQYVNKVLKFLEFDILLTSQNDLEYLKKEINFDEKVLKY